LLFEDILKRVTQSIHIMKVTVKVKLLPTVDQKQALLKTMERFNEAFLNLIQRRKQRRDHLRIETLGSYPLSVVIPKKERYRYPLASTPELSYRTFFDLSPWHSNGFCFVLNRKVL
jgi:hypothetical protein